MIKAKIDSDEQPNIVFTISINKNHTRRVTIFLSRAITFNFLVFAEYMSNLTSKKV